MNSSANMPPDLCLMRAELKDAEEINELINIAYNRDCFRNGDAFPRTSLEEIKNYFTDPEYIWYVIKDTQTNKILCTGLYSSDRAQPLVEGNIHLLSAHPTVWGKKFSQFILREMENQAKQDHQSKIRLRVVNTSPRLIEYYKQNGYYLTGEEFLIPEDYIRSEFRGKDADGKSKVFTLLMEKDLGTV